MYNEHDTLASWHKKNPKQVDMLLKSIMFERNSRRYFKPKYSENSVYKHQNSNNNRFYYCGSEWSWE